MVEMMARLMINGVIHNFHLLCQDQMWSQINFDASTTFTSEQYDSFIDHFECSDFLSHSFSQAA